MKTALYGVMLAALLAAGCIRKAPFAWPDDKATPAEQAVQPRKHVPVVRPNQVTPENALEKARALEEEIENDSEAPKK
jgi:predicted small lipoprotein YifL